MVQSRFRCAQMRRVAHTCEELRSTPSPAPNLCYPRKLKAGQRPCQPENWHMKVEKTGHARSTRTTLRRSAGFLTCCIADILVCWPSECTRIVGIGPFVGRQKSIHHRPKNPQAASTTFRSFFTASYCVRKRHIASDCDTIAASQPPRFPAAKIICYPRK